MKDALDAATGLGYGLCIVDIGLNEAHCLQPAEVFALSGDKVIDAADSLAARQQFGGNRSANKTGCSSN
jgi:hypothetical protein